MTETTQEQKRQAAFTDAYSDLIRGAISTQDFFNIAWGAALLAIEAEEPAAHMFPSDLENFERIETFAHAYSVPSGNPEESTVPLYLHQAATSGKVFDDDEIVAALLSHGAELYRTSIDPVDPHLGGRRSQLIAGVRSLIDGGGQ